jgi:hypothetical protein
MALYLYLVVPRTKAHQRQTRVICGLLLVSKKSYVPGRGLPNLNFLPSTFTHCTRMWAFTVVEKNIFIPSHISEDLFIA